MDIYFERYGTPSPASQHTSLCLSEVKGTLCFFSGLALDGVGIDHSGSDIAVAK